MLQLQHVQTCGNMHRHVRAVNSFQGAFVATVQQFFALMKISFSKGNKGEKGQQEGEGGWVAGGTTVDRRFQSAPVGATSNMWQGE